MFTKNFVPNACLVILSTLVISCGSDKKSEQKKDTATKLGAAKSELPASNLTAETLALSPKFESTTAPASTTEPETTLPAPNEAAPFSTGVFPLIAEQSQGSSEQVSKSYLSPALHSKISNKTLVEAAKNGIENLHLAVMPDGSDFSASEQEFLLRQLVELKEFSIAPKSPNKLEKLFLFGKRPTDLLAGTPDIREASISLSGGDSVYLPAEYEANAIKVALKKASFSREISDFKALISKFRDGGESRKRILVLDGYKTELPINSVKETIPTLKELDVAVVRYGKTLTPTPCSVTLQLQYSSVRLSLDKGKDVLSSCSLDLPKGLTSEAYYSQLTRLPQTQQWEAFKAALQALKTSLADSGVELKTSDEVSTKISLSAVTESLTELLKTLESVNLNTVAKDRDVIVFQLSLWPEPGTPKLDKEGVLSVALKPFVQAWTSALKNVEVKKD